MFSAEVTHPLTGKESVCRPSTCVSYAWPNGINASWRHCTNNAPDRSSFYHQPHHGLWNGCKRLGFILNNMSAGLKTIPRHHCYGWQPFSHLCRVAHLYPSLLSICKGEKDELREKELTSCSRWPADLSNWSTSLPVPRCHSSRSLSILPVVFVAYRKFKQRANGWGPLINNLSLSPIKDRPRFGPSAEPKLFITCSLLVTVNNGQQDESTSGVVKVLTPNKFPFVWETGSAVQAGRLTVTSRTCFLLMAKQPMRKWHFTVVAINTDGDYEKHAAPKPISFNEWKLQENKIIMGGQRT